MSFPYIEQNSESRRKLEDLAATLTDDDLTLVTPYGWSVAALFAHMAWWDQRVLVLLRRWKANGVDDSPVDSNAVNEALKPLCHVLEPRAALHLCLTSAEETDAELSTTSTELFAQIEVSLNHFRMNRALHRNDHIHDIESLVREKRAARAA
jgi:hypothetical protein